MHFKHVIKCFASKYSHQMLGNLMTHDLSQPVLEAVTIYEPVVSHPLVLLFNQVLKAPASPFCVKTKTHTPPTKKKAQVGQDGFVQ